MENRAYALITGFFLLGIVAAIAVTAQWLGGDHTDRVPYRVVSTQSVSGLNVQGSVRYRGIGVGRVTKIALDPKDPQRILIDVDVNSDIPVSRGTYAQLGMEGITGVAYVHLLDEGKDPAPAAKGADGIAEIATRPSFMDNLSDSAEGVAKDARELVVNLNKLLTAENRQRIGNTLASLEKTALHLEATSQKLPAAIERADARIAAWLSEDNRKLARQSLENISQASSKLNDTAATLPELAREAQRLAQDTRALVEKMSHFSAEAQGTALSLREGTLPQVNALAESVERGAQRIGRLATELDRQPDSMLWGRKAGRAGPGEQGFE
jgi:phospholipid/cholesterol/gamma-HCH transport system substrate-binding protein